MMMKLISLSEWGSCCCSNYYYSRDSPFCFHLVAADFVVLVFLLVAEAEVGVSIAADVDHQQHCCCSLEFHFSNCLPSAKVAEAAQSWPDSSLSVFLCHC